MINSKYLELVDLVGDENAQAIREIGAKLQADFEQAGQLRKQAVDMMSVPRRAFSGPAECVTTGHGTEHEISKAAEFLEGLDCEFRPEIRRDCRTQPGALNWRGMPLICHDLDDKPSTWTCAYCGKVNPDSALTCGQGEWDGCGAPKPGCEESLC